MKNKNIILHAFLILLSLCFLLPLVLVISISFSSEAGISQYGYTLLPKIASLDAYRQIFLKPQKILDAYKVTIIYSAVGTVFSVLVMSMAAYPLSRPNYKYKKLVTYYFFFTMLFGGGLIPMYIVNTQYYHLNDTIWVYILHGAVNVWNLIIIRTFFQGLPDSLVEAAKIDGASEGRVFFSIILPLSKPVLATIALMTLLAKWNDWNTSLVYINDESLYSLQFLLQKILREAEFIQKMASEGIMDSSGYEAPAESMRFAMAVLASGPMLVVFPFFQKYFTKGLTVGAVKG